MDERTLGVDVGGTNIKACIADRTGHRLASRTSPTPGTVPELLEAIAEIATWSRDAAGASLRIGVVVPGIVDEESGVAIRSTNLGWSQAPLRALIGQALSMKIAFGHDVRAGALAEHTWGVGGGDMIYIPIGTGIAAAVMLRGKPVITGGYAGEIGQVLTPDPHTGEPTRLELIASASAIARRYGDRHHGFGADCDARTVVARAKAGDPTATAVLSEAIAALGTVLATVLGVLGPLRIVIGGGLAGAGELLLAPLRGDVASRLVVTPPPIIMAATLGPWSQALGAAALAQQEDS